MTLLLALALALTLAPMRLMPDGPACPRVGDPGERGPASWGDARTQRWQDLIEHIAPAHGLDPHVVATIVAIESGGHAGIVEPSTLAVGLMQVLPLPGRPAMDQLVEPAINVRAGCAILAEFLRWEHGDLARALCRYGGQRPGGSGCAAYLAAFDRAWRALWPWLPSPLAATGGR